MKGLPAIFLAIALCGFSLTVRAEMANGRLRLRVADQGIGIPQTEQGKLFQRFYRVDSSLRRSTQGAGLGLFLCRAIVEAHGGRIEVESEPGKGTVFIIRLPLSNDPAADDSRTGQQTSDTEEMRNVS